VKFTGIKDLAILSEGTTYENIRSLKTKLKKLKFNQRQLSKKVKGSSSRNKQKQKLDVVHEKINNVRKDYLHKVSTEIVNTYLSFPLTLLTTRLVAGIVNIEPFIETSLFRNKSMSVYPTKAI